MNEVLRPDDRTGLRWSRLGGCLVAGALALWMNAVPRADAQTFLGPDLTPGPDFTVPCANACTVFGLTGPFNPPGTTPVPITAPEDGSITEVQIRSQFTGVPTELVQLELTGNNSVRFKSFHPLGTTSANGINSFDGLDIAVTGGTVLGVSVDPLDHGGAVDGYNTPGQNGVGVVDPTPAQGQEAAPAGGGGVQPAIRLAFIPANPPPGAMADIEVTKVRLSKRRPGVGGTAVFRVAVTNKGPDGATGVTMYDSFNKAELIYRSGGPLAGNAGMACAPLVGPVPPSLIPAFPFGGDTTVRCPIGALAAGATANYEFSFEVGPLPFDVQSKVYRNYAAGEPGAPPDPDYGNNFAEAQIKVRRAGCRVRDVIDGTEQRDKLTGSRKPEAIYGLGERDKLKGADGDDCLFGNEGDDKLIGGPGRDLINGGEGDDVIKAVDGERDRIDCAEGDKDRAKVDEVDKAKGCEKVKVA